MLIDLVEYIKQNNNPLISITRSAFIHHWTDVTFPVSHYSFITRAWRPHSCIASIVTSYIKFFSLSSTLKSLNILRYKNVPSWLHNANWYLWIHEQARWSESFNLIGYPRPILPAQDFPYWSCKTKFSFWPCLTKFIQQIWLDINLDIFCLFIDLNFNLVHKNTKKDLTDIQPSWPHACSITQMNMYYSNLHFWEYFTKF